MYDDQKKYCSSPLVPAATMAGRPPLPGPRAPGAGLSATAPDGGLREPDPQLLAPAGSAGGEDAADRAATQSWCFRIFMRELSGSGVTVLCRVKLTTYELEDLEALVLAGLSPEEQRDQLPKGFCVDEERLEEMRCGVVRCVNKWRSRGGGGGGGGATEPEGVDGDPREENLAREALRLTHLLRKACTLWHRARPGASLLVPCQTGVEMQAPKVTVERIGSHAVEISWNLPGVPGEHVDVDFFEVEARKYNFDKRDKGTDLPALESLGTFVVSGGERTYTFRSLRPCRYHKIRVRAVQRRSGQASPWSAEVTAKTLTVESSRERGRPQSTARFLAPSERNLQEHVAPDDEENPHAATAPSSRPQSAGPGGGYGGGGGSSSSSRGPSPHYQERLGSARGFAGSARARSSSESRRPGWNNSTRSRPVSNFGRAAPRVSSSERSVGGYAAGAGPRRQRGSDLLDAAFGPLDPQKTTKDLLDARGCKDWSEFVHLGQKYGRRRETRDQRIARMRLVLAQQQLYDPKYAKENRWSMGPFFYDEGGRKIWEDLQKRLDDEDQR